MHPVPSVSRAAGASPVAAPKLAPAMLLVRLSTHHDQNEARRPLLMAHSRRIVLAQRGHQALSPATVFDE